MPSWRASARIAAAAALCVIGPLAAAQFETRSATTLTHPACDVAAADFNKDGKQDLAIALDSQSIAVTLGNGDGTFQKTHGCTRRGAALNGSPRACLRPVGTPTLSSRTGAPNALSIFLGNGDGTFQPPTLIRTPQDPGFVIIGDFNGDHIPDLAVADSSFISPYITILLGNGDGTFGTPINIKPPYLAYAFAAGDFDHSGTLDLAVNAYKDATSYLEILLGKGNGTFTQGEDSHLTPRSAFLPLLIFAAMASSISRVPEGGPYRFYLETETARLRPR